MNSVSEPTTRQPRFHLKSMLPRDSKEHGRVASTLELFFDLVFVIAVGIAAHNLQHSVVEGHVAHGFFAYHVVFFGIWWAWMNFTWFANSFDNDDWLYRTFTIIQMSGVLVLAAGTEPAFHDDNYTILVLGYVIMRVALVLQWLRASRSSDTIRNTALTYAIGVAVVQVLWVLWVFLIPHSTLKTVLLFVLILAEISVPLIAERHARTPWHAHHITERYGLFTLILLGESLLGSTNAIIDGINSGEHLGDLIALAILAVVTAASLWWIYFWAPHHNAISTFMSSLRYGYFHYFIFAAAGALSAGIEVQIHVAAGHLHLSPVTMLMVVSGPIALFILGIWWVAMRDVADNVVNTVVPVGALLVLLDPFVPVPLSLIAVILVAIVVTLVVRKPVLPEGELAEH